MIGDALWSHRNVLAEDARRLRDALGLIGKAGDLTLSQALTLAAAVHEIRPRVILDLGTGHGNSAATFAIASERYESYVFTFDLTEHWRQLGLSRLTRCAGPWDRVVPVVGDMTRFDFTRLASVGGPVLLFWDAHGYAIAEHVLGHLMPMIADQRHLVICHDIADNRFAGTEYKEYAGKRMWHGMDGYYASPDLSALVNIGWLSGIVDQMMPILDFCYRNDMELRSCDFEFRRMLDAGRQEEVIAALPELANVIYMAHFTMNDTVSRRFPPLAPAFAAALAARGPAGHVSRARGG